MSTSILYHAFGLKGIRCDTVMAGAMSRSGQIRLAVGSFAYGGVESGSQLKFEGKVFLWGRQGLSAVSKFSGR